MSFTGGAEKRINTYAHHDQGTPEIATLKGGGWVVNWASSGEDGDGYGIYHQRFNADGSKHGGETHVSTTTDDVQFEPAVAALSNGGWVETWSSRDSLATSFEIYQQAYNADGTKVGAEVPVNTYATSFQADPHVAAIADGGWVVTWTSQGQDGSGQGILQQAYDAAGGPLAGETQVNAYTTGNQGGDASVTGLADGGWVVTWSSDGQDGDGDGVYQRRYKADGTAASGEMQVNTTTAGYQSLAYSSTTALADGGWVVAWTSSGDVYQQAYKADGTALGVETLVNTYTTGSQSPESILALADGGWVVTWNSSGEDGDGGGVYQQAYNADGTPKGDETRVNTFTTGGQFISRATALADGGWVVTWTSGGNEDGDGYGVYQQRYDAEGQIYGTNHAPTAHDGTITDLTNGNYVFSKKTFGFSDGTDGDHLSSVVITALPSGGKLVLGDSAVTAGQEIAAADLKELVWQAGKHALSATLSFQVTDDGGTEAGGKNMSEIHTLTFAIERDTFTGTKAADTLSGTDGHDIFNGKGGNDRLTGGLADDTFVFRTGDGKDTITDFDHSEGDRIDLSHVDGITSYSGLVHNHLSERNGDLRISDDHGDMIVLKHTSADDLHKGDFVF